MWRKTPAGAGALVPQGFSVLIGSQSRLAIFRWCLRWCDKNSGSVPQRLTCVCAGQRPFSGADDGIRTRDPHLGNGARSVRQCSSSQVKAHRTRWRPATDRGERWRTEEIGARNGANAVRGGGVRTPCRGGTRAPGAAKLDQGDVSRRIKPTSSTMTITRW